MQPRLSEVSIMHISTFVEHGGNAPKSTSLAVVWSALACPKRGLGLMLAWVALQQELRQNLLQHKTESVVSSP